MHRLVSLDLQQSTLTYLQQMQEKIDALPTTVAQATTAKKLWASKGGNKTGKTAIGDLRKALGKMAGALERCMYCEDSAADEIEHHHPKDLYPALTFVWSNHLFACGPCNGPKNNKFAVVETVENILIDVQAVVRAGNAIPAGAAPALIDPRKEDPLGYLWLDLQDTFEFLPSAEPGTIGHTRGKYTIQVLRLNARDVLVAARRNAFTGFQARLSDYAGLKKIGAPEAELGRARKELLSAPHFTVWLEMQRQQDAFPRLTALFAEVPEAHDWKRA